MDGLNKQEIEYRQNNGMINNENIKNSRTVKQIILSNTITLFNILNLTLLVLVLTTGSFINTTFIFTIIFNTLISIFQEIKAKKIIDKLSIGTKNKVKVIREGILKEIEPEEILLDDLLYLKQGDNMVVDATVIKSEMCEVDESIITGESDSIKKKPGDKLISGSIITSGNVYAKVSSINRDTYANNLIKEASRTKDNSSYLMKNVNAILKVVTFLIIPTGIMLFISQYFYSGQTYSESILSTVAGIIGMIPEGLVLLTSIALTVGVIKMAKKKVIIQKLSGIEELACVDILCLDKTGTITDGTMKVVETIEIDKRYDMDKIVSNMLVDETNVTDRALLNYYKRRNDMKIIDRLPFSSARKYSKVKFDVGTFALGALEYITDYKTSDYSEYLDKHVSMGYRILTLAKCDDDVNKSTSKVIGFIIIKDNVRPSAKETLKYFKEQDVDIRIISGDNPETISNIVKQLEMDGYDKYISGNDLPENMEEFKKIVKDTKIFGRVTPVQKRQIISCLQENAKVGMIGDGVNDILALKEADCGIALASGASAARSVSEVVLTDSDFSVLPKIVNEGRRVVNNIERVSSMYLVKTTYSFLLSILSIILSHEYPFYPIQLSLISAICVGIPSFFLALEPNYNKVKKGFLVKVFRNALPSGIAVFLNALFIIMFYSIFKLDFDKYRIVIVAVTGYINLRLLYKVSKPLTFLRKLLLVLCSLVFYFTLFKYSELLFVSNYSWLSIALIVLLIVTNTYITEYLEHCYDKIVYIIEERKNKKWIKLKNINLRKKSYTR